MPFNVNSRTKSIYYQIIVYSFILASCSELACTFTSREAYQYSNTNFMLTRLACVTEDVHFLVLSLLASSEMVKCSV